MPSIVSVLSQQVAECDVKMHPLPCTQSIHFAPEQVIQHAHNKRDWYSKAHSTNKQSLFVADVKPVVPYMRRQHVWLWCDLPGAASKCLGTINTTFMHRFVCPSLRHIQSKR